MPELHPQGGGAWDPRVFQLQLDNLMGTFRSIADRLDKLVDTVENNYVRKDVYTREHNQTREATSELRREHDELFRMHLQAMDSIRTRWEEETRERHERQTRYDKERQEEKEQIRQAQQTARRWAISAVAIPIFVLIVTLGVQLAIAFGGSA